MNMNNVPFLDDMSLPLDNMDFYVFVVPFPNRSSRAFTTPNDDGTYNVYIDANLDYETQLDGYWHEFKHIAFQDFCREDESIQEIEDVDIFLTELQQQLRKHKFGE